MTEIDTRQLRKALGRFATGVTIVTTTAADGTPVGITANSFGSVSLDPPLVLFSLALEAYSYPHFKDCRHFAVNILRDDYAVMSSRFAVASEDKWTGIRYLRGETGCPLLEGALARFECERRSTHHEGDHCIFVGKVLHLDLAARGRPLLFYEGQYYVLEEEAPSEIEIWRRQVREKLTPFEESAAGIQYTE